MKLGVQFYSQPHSKPYHGTSKTNCGPDVTNIYMWLRYMCNISEVLLKYTLGVQTQSNLKDIVIKNRLSLSTKFTCLFLIEVEENQNIANIATESDITDFKKGKHQVLAHTCCRR